MENSIVIAPETTTPVITTEIRENLERELFTKYTKDLRNLTTEVKYKIMLSFIKREIKKLTRQNEFNQVLNLKNWQSVIENLNLTVLEDKEEIELIFLHSILKTTGLRSYAKKMIK